MVEIQENKRWNEHAVTNEVLYHKLQAVLGVVLDTRERVAKLEKRIDEFKKQLVIVKDILNDHTSRLRALEGRMDKLEP